MLTIVFRTERFFVIDKSTTSLFYVKLSKMDNNKHTEQLEMINDEGLDTRVY